MRAVVATTAGAGHFGPVTPFADALIDAGHDVVVAAPASFAATVQRAGFRHHPVADADPAALGAVFATVKGVSNEEGNAIVIREVFGRLDTGAALPAMRSLLDEWRPHLVLRESSEFASYVAAEAAGIPHVQISAGLTDFEDQYIPVVDEVLTEFGAPPGLGGMLAAPRLSLLPASFDFAVAAGQPVRRYRDHTDAGGSEPVPDWWGGSEAPFVYVTFGSVAAGIGLFPGFYRTIIEALAEVDARILLTLGESGDPEALLPLPANVHVERWWPQKPLMPHAAAMVSHGGMATTTIGLRGGVPMVLIPLFADQPANAQRVQQVGAGICLDGGPDAVEQLVAALDRVLTEPSYRDGASRIAADVAALPPATDAVSFFEEVKGDAWT